MTFVKKLARCAVLLVPLFAPARPLRAASACEAALDAAEVSYELGRFEAVSGQLAPCLHGKVTREETEQAYSMQARAFIALDREAEARAAVVRLLRADPSFEPTEPPLFVRMVKEERRAAASQQVASVSKTPESLREAPATVEVITAEEIQRRGYLDLEQLLHDLPGFDVSRDNGEIYSSFYQRGFRSNNVDRNLLMVDGMEQNDLSSNVVYLSRQYPLSNVDRVEVLYGPASTMYGSNAYTGVINIITKDPEAFISEGRRIGYSAQAGGGSFSTRFADATLAGRDGSGAVAWSLTGRAYHSNEMDLSRFADWDYDLGNVDYAARLRITDPNIIQQIVDCADNCNQSLYTAVSDAAGHVVALQPTAAAVQLAHNLDRQFLAQNRTRFQDATEDWSLDGRLRLSNVTFGFQLWQLREGIAPWFTEAALGGTRADANVWQPRQASFYVRFSRPLSADLTFNLFGRYLDSSLNSRRTLLSLYARGDSPGLSDLVESCSPEFEACPQPAVTVLTSSQVSNQIRTDLNVIYQPLARLSAVGGLELRRSLVARAPTVQASGLGPQFGQISAQSSVEHTDVALYIQGSYALSSRLKLVAGGRLDHSEAHGDDVPGVDNAGFFRISKVTGFGSQFSSRAALVYTPRSDLVFKAIYSDAFKDPSDVEKFISLEQSAQSLRPETVKSFELGAGWQPAPRASFTASAYQARYHRVVILTESFFCVPELLCFPTDLFSNGGEYRIRGLQAGARYRLGALDLDASYTFTDPIDLTPQNAQGEPLLDGNGNLVPQVRIADIASHRVNFGAGIPLGRKLDLSLRTEYIGARRTGPGTSVPDNPLREVPAAFLAHATLSLADVIPGATLQLVVRNLFDHAYYDPGVKSADGILFASRVPQPGRTVYLRLITGAGRAHKTP
ncbi:MAG TPA: TonB-dependent receptor [Thermoanaerobaculia bacterium]|nr:TonB-dependent receptor [Thermoanaerobaculia bacterium]